jgi:hypothetical protein
MIREAKEAPCPASAVPIERRSPEEIVDAGVKAAVESGDTVAFLVYACNAVPIIKPIVKMFIAQFLRRNSCGDE